MPFQFFKDANRVLHLVAVTGTGKQLCVLRLPAPVLRRLHKAGPFTAGNVSEFVERDANASLRVPDAQRQ